MTGAINHASAIPLLMRDGSESTPEKPDLIFIFYKCPVAGRGTSNRALVFLRRNNIDVSK